MNTAVLEFHIHTTSRDEFSVAVHERHSSQPLASSQFSFPLSDWMTKHDIARLDFNPRDPQGRLDELRKFGGKLYQLLFPPAVRQLWQQHRDRSDWLTLCLRIDDAAKELEALPWETLHDGTEFIAAGAKTTVTRLPLAVVPPRAWPAIASPLRMLALVSSPPDLPDQSRLNIEAEQEILLEAINAPAGQGKLHVDFEDEAKLAILEASLEADYHILHFTGHGVAPESGGGLLLEDADGKAQVYGAAEILQTLEKGFGTLRLAVLSGCNTAQTRTQNANGFRDLARALAARHVPAVLAMQFKISDTGGLKLAEVLYPKLAAGQSLEEAVNAARRALLLSDDPVLQADALALVLLVADGNCLRTAAPATPPPAARVTLDKKYQLGPLPQLGFGFYGRRREYRQLRDALTNHRAVIIHGIGGIGKTSLSAHAADRLYHRRRRFNGVYAFDCSGGTLAPERLLLELHRYFEMQDVKALGGLLHQPMEPETLAGLLAQALAQTPLLLLFDNFETQLERAGDRFRVADERARRFLAALVKATPQGTKFLFTSRWLFELDERLGDVASLPLGDLSRPEAFSVMLKLPRLAKASYDEKGTIYETFGGHPFALVALDKYCQTVPVAKALRNAKAVHVKLREYLALELNYAKLTAEARELLNRLAAFRTAVLMEAAEWVIGETAAIPDEALRPMLAVLRQAMNNDALPEHLKNQSQQLKDADDATLLQMLRAMLPARRQAPDGWEQSVRELIEWGLLTPVYEDDALVRVDVHSLVRDFCRDKQPEAWRDRLREAAAFYTNVTRLIPDDQKTLAVVMADMEAFELLIEAEDFRDAASLLTGAHELLDRWGLGRYVESQYTRVLDKLERADYAQLIHNFGVLQQARGDYEGALDYYGRSLKIKEELGNKAGVASSLHQLGNLQYLRGDYEGALDYYGRSLKIKEELGDKAGVARSLHQLGMVQQDRGDYEGALDYYGRSLKLLEELGNKAGVASSQGQIGKLLMDTENFGEAFGLLLQSLATFLQLQSPNARIVANMLRTLRGKWDGFDAAWQAATDGDVPEWLKNAG
jgi:tetratricopeptide (TPR) repeat protein/CHAT domain-containing protein